MGARKVQPPGAASNWDQGIRDGSGFGTDPMADILNSSVGRRIVPPAPDPKKAVATPTLNWVAFLAGETMPDKDDRLSMGLHTPALLAVTLQQHLRDSFPINRVPQELVDLYERVEASSRQLVHDVGAFADAMREACGQEDKGAAHTHYSYGPDNTDIGLMCDADMTPATRRSHVNNGENPQVDCPGCVKAFQDSRDRG